MQSNDEPDAELTMAEAAELLNVSVPYVAQLAGQGDIPLRAVDVGTRVRRKDVLAFKTRIDAERRKVLDELAAQAQELGMGYE